MTLIQKIDLVSILSSHMLSMSFRTTRTLEIYMVQKVMQEGSQMMIFKMWLVLITSDNVKTSIKSHCIRSNGPKMARNVWPVQVRGKLLSGMPKIWNMIQVLMFILIVSKQWFGQTTTNILWLATKLVSLYTATKW